MFTRIAVALSFIFTLTGCETIIRSVNSSLNSITSNSSLRVAFSPALVNLGAIAGFTLFDDPYNDESLSFFGSNATVLQNGKVLFVGSNHASIYDPLTNTFSAAAAPLAGHYITVATLLADGRVLVAGGAGWGTFSNAEIYNPVTNAWTIIPSMSVARDGHTLTLLPNGTVIAVGGWSAGSAASILSSTEIYDPLSNTWSAGPSLASARLLHTTTLLQNGKLLVVGGMSPLAPPTVTGLLSAEYYDTANPGAGWVSAGNMTTVGRWSHAATLLADGNVLVSGGTGGGAPTVSAQLYTAGTNSWSALASLNQSRQNHAAILLPNDKVLVLGGNGFTNGEIYDPANPGLNWVNTTGSLSTIRIAFTMSELSTGKILIAGGNDNVGTSAMVELFDPSNTTFSSNASAPLAAVRYNHTSTQLLDGKILATGGTNDSTTSLATCEIYDPVADTWSAAASLNTARNTHTATLLQNGKVLVVGGIDNGSSALASAEVYDPSFNTWTPIASLSTGRMYHTATLLQNGKVLVTGGFDASWNLLASSEVYDPANSGLGWVGAANLNSGRAWHTATLLQNGDILVVGGTDAIGPLQTTETYNVATGWTALANLNGARMFHTATLLQNGDVLVVGGMDNSGVIKSAELFDMSSWTPVGDLNTERSYHTATALQNGNVLVAGGSDNLSILSSAEVYDSIAKIWTTTATLNVSRQAHTASLLADGRVFIHGGQSMGDVAFIALSQSELYTAVDHVILNPTGGSGSYSYSLVSGGGTLDSANSLYIPPPNFVQAIIMATDSVTSETTLLTIQP